jgi:transketolase
MALNSSLLATAIRILSVDAVEQANSGHPGMPLGMADIATVLWQEFLQHNPLNPLWPNRDRFVLSNGHGSMLLYSLLHLTGYDLSLEDLKKFRQLHSRTPGHPEYGHTAGVEATTGPLGQGLANAVGMALASKILASTFNKPNLAIFNNFIYCFVGDGCLMEGVSHEASSFAGSYGLNNLIVFWDDNGISIDGLVKNWCRDDVILRFTSYGWHIISIDGHNLAEIRTAIQQAQQQSKPVLICCKTIIGLGSPNFANSAHCHGSPFGAQEVAAIRQQLNWPYAPFIVPAEVYQQFDAKAQGALLTEQWQQMLQQYQILYPTDFAQLQRRLNKELPQDWDKFIPHLNEQICATRKASQMVLEQFNIPELLAGSADLTSSNLTATTKSQAITYQNFAGNYLHYGVREFGMAAIMNGISLFGGLIPYGGTFLVFSDYARNAIRMSALMGLRVIYVLTHDSIGLGEDGPTHQPIEHLASLRLIPNLEVWRPANLLETAIAWQMALLNLTKPTCLCLSRQVSKSASNYMQLENIHKGGYIYQDNMRACKLNIIATGTELALVLQALAKLPLELKESIKIISMPCVEKFCQQPQSYQQHVLPTGIARLIVEAGATSLWYKLVGHNGKILGLDNFGYSAPQEDVYAASNLTEQAVITSIMELTTGDYSSVGN